MYSMHTREDLSQRCLFQPLDNPLLFDSSTGNDGKIHLHAYVCVCVCVCVRERETERQRAT